MSYKSVMHTTCNEAGDHEVEIVYERGVLRRLLNLPEIKETYVGHGGTVWHRKGTGEMAGTMKTVEILKIVEKLRQNKVYYGQR